MKTHHTFSQSLAALALIAIAGPLSAQSPPPVTPFELRMSLQETVSMNTDCPMFSVKLTGSGLSTPLGPVTIAAQHCATADAQGNLAFPEGAITLSTPEGDQLNATYTGVAAATQVPQIFHLFGTFRITGGTGRFDQASGTGVLRGLDRAVPEQNIFGPGHLEAVGVIRYSIPQ